jgi:hypothetical protein
MPDDRDYEVGYGKPPAHTRWKPGQSGNPKGRPRRTTDLAKLIDAELDQLVQINENGRRRTLTKREVFAKALVHDGAKGNAQARRMLYEHLMKQHAVEDFETDPEDFAALAELIDDKRRGKQADDDAEDQDA